MAQINEAFKQLIHQLPIPITELAKMAGCNASTIYCVINGRAMKRHTRNRLIEALGKLGYTKEEVAALLPLEEKTKHQGAEPPSFSHP
ncbi:MAG: helix-turn-helix domain-containing protein [Acidobacterium ailaaui]|nr:helix-turn-helix domain-containing protein [Pseudacidobacterium ailaaui]